MSFKNIVNSITAYFQDVANRNFLIVRFDNDPRATPTDNLWCKVSINLDNSMQKEIGINSYRNIGDFTIEIYNSIKIGQSPILRIIDRIVKQFTQETINDSVKFQTPKVKNIGRINDNYQINVVCPFYVDN